MTGTSEHQKLERSIVSKDKLSSITRDEGGIELSVVMPCLNEAKSIGKCVAEALEASASLGLKSEVVICDNGSEDASVEIAKNAGARVVHQPIRGYGSAYLKGIEEAKGKYIVIADSDGTYDFKEIKKFLDPLKSGFDFVIGSRLKGQIRKGAMPFLHRYVGVPILTGMLNLISGTRLSDAHCGMRSFSKEAYQRMKLRTPGMEFASEMILGAARAKLKIAEIPIDYYPREGESKLRTLRDGWRHLRFILVYSPTLLFLVPGVLFLASGLVLLVALLAGPLRFAGFFMDIHYMVLGSLLAIVGFQVINLGVFAKAFAVTQGLVPEDRLIHKLNLLFSLERGLIAGLLTLLLGLGLLVFILLRWIVGGFNFGGDVLIRPALFGMSFAVLGAQMVFGSFFLSLLQAEKRHERYHQAD